MGAAAALEAVMTLIALRDDVGDIGRPVHILGHVCSAGSIVDR